MATKAKELVLVDFGLCCPASDAERRTIATLPISAAFCLVLVSCWKLKILITNSRLENLPQVGSLLYVAPEVFSRRYDAKVGNSNDLEHKSVEAILLFGILVWIYCIT